MEDSERNRELIAESERIADGQTAMLASRDHIKALVSRLRELQTTDAAPPQSQPTETRFETPMLFVNKKAWQQEMDRLAESNRVMEQNLINGMVELQREMREFRDALFPPADASIVHIGEIHEYATQSDIPTVQPLDSVESSVTGSEESK